LEADLQPVMTLESRLMAVHQRAKGESIGYGQEWVCPQDMRIGVVAIGYGDGYPRHAPSGTPLLVNGKTVTLVGRVSMDMVCVDLRKQPDAKAGDIVTLWGAGIPVEKVAQHAGTISYELLCGVTSRVPRFYQSN
ncbi:MAG: alanine racemase, partial [Thiogranum sp.]